MSLVPEKNPCKESIYVLVFLHGISHKGKVTSDSITFGWLLLCVFFFHPISLHEFIHQGKVTFDSDIF